MDLKILLFMLFLGGINAKSSAPLKTLVNLLFADYDNIIPPLAEGMNVSHGITLKRIVGFDGQVLTLNTNNEMGWIDGRLTWNPDSYDGIELIGVPASKLWKPDIVLYNDASECTSGQAFNAVVDYTGRVTYVPKATFRAYCNIKPKVLEKKRKVKCTLEFGSWTSSAEVLDIYDPAGDFILADLVQNPQWKVVDSSVKKEEMKYSCCPNDTFVKLLYTLKLKPMP